MTVTYLWSAKEVVNRRVSLRPPFLQKGVSSEIVPKKKAGNEGAPQTGIRKAEVLKQERDV